MANIYRNDKVSLTSTANTTLYTVPSNSRAIVKSLLVVEDNAGAAVVKATLTNAAGTAFVIDNNISLSANEKEQVLTEPLIMLESEILKVQASSGQVDAIASILEINREDR
jgi:hypothetical protein|tara:strand:+ start:776 stop:1108 length:333 start_codon:yes stop_codon:yes gene_type:complete